VIATEKKQQRAKTITVNTAIAKSGKSRTISINKNLTAPLKEIKKEMFKVGEYVFTGTKPSK